MDSLYKLFVVNGSAVPMNPSLVQQEDMISFLDDPTEFSTTI